MSDKALIRTIKSTEKTETITRAMNLVATSKLAKTQQNMARSKPYAEKINELVGHVAHSQCEYRHPFLVERPRVKRVAVIVITSDRGLCGSLNHQLLRSVVNQMATWQAEKVETCFCLMGSRGVGFFRRHHGDILAEVVRLGDRPSPEDVIGVSKVAVDAFLDDTVDEIYLAANTFVNVMVQRPVLRRLVPIVKTDLPNQAGYWDYIYEPDAKLVIDRVMQRYIENQVYHAVIEHVACEQAARMVAMKNATENAGRIIDDLKKSYNKARQAAITQELAEIVAGASAVE